MLCIKVQYYVENGRLIRCVPSPAHHFLTSFLSCVLIITVHHPSLSSLLTPCATLSSCFHFFGFGTSERKARHLYYSDLRERVLRSECRQQEEVYFQLAGYAMQADLGDHQLPKEGEESAPYFEPKEYFPPWVYSMHFMFQFVFLFFVAKLAADRSTDCLKFELQVKIFAEELRRWCEVVTHT